MNNTKRMNRWELHVHNWKHCTRCNLHYKRQNTVLVRGSIPCDIMFIGEAPGHAEDSIGEPFVGETGSLLQHEIIDIAIPKDIRYSLCNLLACIPLDKDGIKTEEPDEDNVMVCADRLVDLISFSKPKLLVLVGKHSQHYFDVTYKHRIKIANSIPRIGIYHPSYISRKPNERELLIDETIIDIKDAIKEHLNR